MAAMKVLLFVTVIASAIVYAHSIKCYACDSAFVGEKCAGAQSKHSNVMDCDKLSPLTGLEYACARYDYAAGKYDHFDLQGEPRRAHRSVGVYYTSENGVKNSYVLIRFSFIFMLKHNQKCSSSFLLICEFYHYQSMPCSRLKAI
nr:unnamed protein product [Callosobruchus analis]